MKSFLLITSLIICAYLSKAQTYEIYKNNSYGVPVMTGYIKEVNTQPQFSQYIGQVDVDLYGKLLMQKRMQNDFYVKQIQNLVDDCSYYLKDLYMLDRNAGYAFGEKLDSYIKNLNRQKIDYSSSGESIVSDLKTYLNAIRDQIRYSQSQKVITYEQKETYVKPTPKKVYSGTVEVFTNTHIKKEPKSGAEIIGLAEDGVVTILSQYDEYYYFVQSKKIRGYILVNFIK